MKKYIAILAGGDSRESEISFKSAGQVMKWLNQDKYEAILIEVKGKKWSALDNNESKIPVDLRDFSIVRTGKKIRFEYAFIIIHGTPGEDGKIQAYLEIQGIPYNTSGVLSSALTFNKYASKIYLKNMGVPVPEAALIKKGTELNIADITGKTGLPCFVKPNNGGSSFGASKVNRSEDIEKAILIAFGEDEEVLVESYVKGTEISCGLLKTKDEVIIFPLTEIKTSNEFFDYEAKYIEGKAEEITPARVSEDISRKCRTLSSEIYDHLMCRGIVRIDYIVKGNQLYFLELNSIPGMSKESIVPKQIRAMGYTVEEILDKVMNGMA